MSQRSNAFTLIELLVVIAIIAILAAILFPVFARARENARRSSCSSNMKQLGLGFIQYMQDYDGRYPKAGNWQVWGNGGHWVAGVNGSGTDGAPGALAKFTPPYTATAAVANIQGGALYPYIKSTQIYVCPSSRDGQKTGLSYGMNCTLAAASENSVESTTEVALLVDEAYPTDAFFWATADGTASDQLTKAHLEGGNVLFCDGHVKFYPYSRFNAGDNATDATAGATKTRTTGQPRFFDSAATAACTFN
ncbi:hypothetical protein IAD21_01027 [Abditibacteriota bacterium]|nr:hypothetical protein IAD21_01027 [Abditibacteriota bacterium]